MRGKSVKIEFRKCVLFRFNHGSTLLISDLRYVVTRVNTSKYPFKGLNIILTTSNSSTIYLIYNMKTYYQNKTATGNLKNNTSKKNTFTLDH